MVTEATNMSIVFFDGTCTLCNRFVDFIILRDRHRVFHLASLQGETAKSVLPEIPAPSPGTIVLYDHGQIDTKSAAVLKIFAQLPGFWSWLACFKVLPKRFRDGLYDFIAKNRYKIFGRRETCRAPTEDERAYFLP